MCEQICGRIWCCNHGFLLYFLGVEPFGFDFHILKEKEFGVTIGVEFLWALGFDVVLGFVV